MDKKEIKKSEKKKKQQHVIAMSDYNLLSLILLSFVTITTCIVVERESSKPIPDLFGSKTDIHITNNLGPNKDLGLHCKSKATDLGAQVVANGQSYVFGFEPNIWRTTLYFCGFRWGPPDEFHWFDIYDAGDDSKSACTACLWSVVPSGPCRFDRSTGYYDICFPWKVKRK